MRQRKRSRGKGELGKMLERWIDQHGREMTVFRHMLEEASSSSSSAVTGGYTAGCDVIRTMRCFAGVITDEHHDSNLSLCVCRVAAAAVGDATTGQHRYLHVMLPNAVKRMVPNIQMGSLVNFYEPWDVLAVPSARGGDHVLLASERCQVLQVLDLQSMHLHEVDELLKQQPRSRLPSDIVEQLVQSPTAPLEGQPISLLPLATLSLEDDTVQVALDKCTHIKDLDAWMSPVTVRATVIRGFPHSALVRNMNLQDLEQGEDNRPELAWLAHTVKSSTTLPCMPPIFFLADSTGVVAVQVPDDEAIERDWLEIILADGVVKAEFYTLVDLAFQSATGGVDLCKRMGVQFPLPTGGMLPISPAILLVTRRTAFAHAHAPTMLLTDAPALRNRKLVFDVFDKGGELLQTAGAATSLQRDIISGSPARATLLVIMEYMATAPSGTWSEGNPSLLLCVRDESLAPVGLHNVLIVVTDICQMLACSAVLKEGDILLIRDALVFPASSCPGGRVGGGAGPVHSSLGSLIVDTTSSISRVHQLGITRTAGVGKGVEASSFEESHGGRLPCIYLDGRELNALKDVCRSMCGVRGLPLLAQQTCEDNAWLSFAGQIVSVHDVSTRAACPYCGSGRLQYSAADEETQPAGGSAVGSDRFLCLACQKLFTGTVKVIRPCSAVIEYGLHRCTVWLGEHIIATLNKNGQLPRLRKAAQLQSYLERRTIRGVVLRCCNSCTTRDTGGSVFWATHVSLE